MEHQNLSFYHLGIAPKMLEILEKKKFESPTPIQHKAIPIALENQDLLGIAQTGTGKTLSFGIPMVQRLNGTKMTGLVIVPTRELAIQVNQALQDFLKPFEIRSVVLIGGTPMFRQVKGLKKKPQIIVATPGRLIDHVERKTANLKNVGILVLDEADRMFDMGFAPQIKKVVEMVPKDRQTMLYSATMPQPIIDLAAKFMRLPTHIEIAPEGTTSENVSQELFIVKESDKDKLLGLLLQQYRGSVLLFVRTKVTATKMLKKIKAMGHNGTEIHSDRSMGQRKQAIEGFKSGKFRVLVATDVAARGIDVQMIELVINYDLPDDIENYVHRIGRTGRAGDEGHAITFATPKQGYEISRIEKIIRKTLPVGEHPDMPLEKFQNKPKNSGGKKRRGGGGGKKKFGKGSSGRGKTSKKFGNKDKKRKPKPASRANQLGKKKKKKKPKAS